MKKRLLSSLMILVMLISMLPMMTLKAEATTKLSYEPYAEVEYGYTTETPVRTIRYISQNSYKNGSDYFYKEYWPDYSFDSYNSPVTECGTACISMALSYVGVNRTPKQLLMADGVNGETSKMWGKQGDATSRSIPKTQDAVAAAMDDYIAGEGKYSPLCVYIIPFRPSSDKHWILLVGKIGNNKYLALNPWHENGSSTTFTIEINGTTATHGGYTDNIDSIAQWYNPNATPPMVTENYRCYGKLKIIKDGANVKSLPCSEETSAESITVEPAKKGSTYTAIELVRNIPGNLWYKVTAKNGQTGYVYSGDAEFTQLTSDLSPEGIVAPTKIKQGAGFGLEGIIRAKYQNLCNVGTWVYTPTGEYATGDDVDVNTSSYNLLKSDLDKATEFSKLKAKEEEYTFKIEVSVKTYYAKTTKEVGTKTTEKIQIFSRPFYVSQEASGGETAGTYTIKFQPNGGTCDTSELKVTQGSIIGVLPEAELGFMGFEGWYTEPYTGELVTMDTVPTEDMELWAHYTHPISQVKLSFDPNGGTIPGAVLSEVIDGVNRGRPGETLVAFNKAGTQPGTNTYGVEAAVNSSGQIVGWRDYGDKNQLTVPKDGFILSGQSGWDPETSSSVGGVRFMWAIEELIDAGKDVYISLNYETGEVKVFDSFAGYLAEIKRGQEWTRYGILPVPVREGHTFKGWRTVDWYDVDYYSGFIGMDLVAMWDENTDLYPTKTMEYNGHYYEVYDHNVTWTEARELCESMGGYLVTITSASEQAAIMDLLKNSIRGSYRIGATDEQKDGTWTWVNGETFSYNNWDPDYPEPNTEKGKNYANLIAVENPPNKQLGEWYVSNAVYYTSFYDLSNTGFICEYDHFAVCDHQYSYEVMQEPTKESGGILRECCTLCGKYTDTGLPVLNKTDYEYTLLTAPTCSEEGLEQYRWMPAGGIVLDFTVRIPLVDHNYLAEHYEATCEKPAKTRYTCSNCGDWFETYEGSYSEWSEEYPEGIAPEMVEERTEYRFQKKEYATNVESTMDGWTLYDATTQWGEYSEWSEWSTTKPTASESTKVEERTVYGYYYYLCSACGAHMHGYGNCYTWAGGCGAKTTNSGWHAIWSTISWDKAKLKDWYGTGKYYTYIDGELVFKWTDGGSKTEYRDCSREMETVYHFYRWSEWSDWTPNEVLADENTTVESRMVYRYVSGGLGEHQYKEEVTAPTCTEQGYTTHTCRCGDSYVDSYVDSLGHTEVIDTAIEPTCTENGLTEGKHCSRCGEILIAQSVVVAKGHIPDEAVRENERDDGSYDSVIYCSACGVELSREYVFLPGVTVSGTVTSYGTATDDVTVALLDANGKTVSSVIVTGNGAEYSFSSVSAGSYTLQISKINHVTRSYTVVVEGSDVTQDAKICLRGDVTGDGKVTATDYSRLLAHVKKTSVITDAYMLQCADVTGEGKLTATDYSRLLAHVKKVSLL